MVSLPIDLVSHPKIPVSLRSITSKTGGSVSLFSKKNFFLCFASVSLRSKIWGHPTSNIWNILVGWSEVQAGRDSYIKNQTFQSISFISLFCCVFIS